jgi:hypothetical protein
MPLTCKKTVKAVEPMHYKNNSNFKLAPYNAWVEAGGNKVNSFYEWRKLRLLLYVLERMFPKRKDSAILCFAEPPSLDVDTFPWWGCYEIIPVLWDCWPKYWDYTEQWLRRHGVKSAVFTSSQTAEEFCHRLPEVNILTITEGIESNIYQGGTPLKERDIDFLQFGRVTSMFDNLNLGEDISVVSSKNEQGLLQTRNDLVDALAKSKIVLAVPRCDMQKELAGGVETLTQRYWECMLSGVIILGRAPKELIDLIGYDPVVQMKSEDVVNQIKELLAHIDDYQDLVNKNRQTAIQMSDWSLRVKQIMRWLEEHGYMV